MDTTERLSLSLTIKQKMERYQLEIQEGDLPGGPVVKNPPCDAGDAGSILGWGAGIPRAAEQLDLHMGLGGSPQAAAADAQALWSLWTTAEPRHNWGICALQ